jgi:menaquinone-specific isochorismate synthase
MPVIPYHANFLQDCQDLYQFLLACKQALTPKNCTQIVSISIQIESVDPLAILQAISKPNQLHFYFEKPCQGEAIAAIDAVTCLKVEETRRFARAQAFIHSCLNDTITAGATHLPFAGPHFFCSFTFFDQPLKSASPFPAATIFLPRWQISRHKECCVAVANLAITANTDLEALSKKTCREFQSINLAKYISLGLSFGHRPELKKQDLTDTNNFKAAVLSALESIQAQHFNKIVLAHAVDVISPVPLSLAHSLNNLRQIYPDCAVFSISNGKGQSFIGASPERLIHMHNRELTTDALAGSAPRGKTAVEDAYLANRLLGSEKEMREHQVVIDFITDCLVRLGLLPQRSPRPQLLQLSNIQHLQTPIQARVPANVHLLEILAELHPTPAVAGAPRDITCQRIRRYETFERALYAAPLGWVDHQGNGEFMVGIRSALVDGCQARLYAGAGIVAGSDPEKELAEIKLKLQALLAALA